MPWFRFEIKEHCWTECSQAVAKVFCNVGRRKSQPKIDERSVWG